MHIYEDVVSSQFIHVIYLGLLNDNLKFHICSDLVVASPVEDFFLYIDDLPYPEKVRMHALFIILFLNFV